MSRIRRHLTYSNVMVTILAFIVLGGGAYAAIHLPKNSVGTKQLKKNAVIGSKVKDHSLSPSDVENIVAKPHGNTDVSTGDGVVSYPLSGSTWTQRAGEVDLLTGSVTYTVPASCGGNGLANIAVHVLGLSFGASVDGPAGTTHTESLSAADVGKTPGYLAALPSSTARTVTADVSDSCFSPDEQFVIHSIKLAVFGVR